MSEQTGKRALTAAEKIVFLKSTDLFREIPIEKLLPVAKSLVVKNFSKGEVIVTQGDVGEELFLVVTGRVKVETRSEDGKVIPRTELGEGQGFGEMSLLDKQVRSATVTAVEDTRCLTLNGDEFKRLAHEDPDLSLELAAVLSRRLRATMLQS